MTLAVAIGARANAAYAHSVERAHPGTCAYLQQLQKWGYTLSDIEERVIELATGRS